MFPVLLEKGRELWFCIMQNGTVMPVKGPYYKQTDGSWK
jgi:hypothetical protein